MELGGRACRRAGGRQPLEPGQGPLLRPTAARARGRGPLRLPGGCALPAPAAIRPLARGPPPAQLRLRAARAAHAVQPRRRARRPARLLEAEPSGYDRAMCRVVAYLGEPISLEHVLFETDSSLVRQSYSPRMMQKFLNLAGFGMAAWDPRSAHAGDPFTYRVTTLTGFDRNLRNLAAKLEPTCLVAHVRGVTDAEYATVAESNLHPFHFPGARVVLAHNGHLREFSRMRYDLVRHVRPEFARHISGRTDSEWIYALVLSQLDDPYGEPEARELGNAVASTLRLLREARARHGIDTSSPVNLFLVTGKS